MAKISQVFVPKDRVYFERFEAAGHNILEASQALHRLLTDYPANVELAKQIRECEHRGDRITHEILDRLNHTFVTPIEREDILALTSALDDIVDYEDEVADYLGLYKIEEPMEQAVRLTELLELAAVEVNAALPLLHGFKQLSIHTVEINRLENEGDQVTREAMAALFHNGSDPMLVIRWKDLFERLENAIDATEHVAHILEGIVIKNS